MNNSAAKELRTSSGAAPPKRSHLFLQFSTLSFAAFLLIGYFVVSAIRPAIFNFVVSRQEADTVVFVNRFANRLLTEGNFTAPLALGGEEPLAIFVEGLQIPARLAVFVTNPDGTILASDIQELVGSASGRTPGFERAARERRSAALFRNTTESEKELLGVQEVFELFIPVTFGASPEVVGIVHSLSRTGFIRETARKIERDIAIRIGAGLLFLYAVLSVIVWGASRTIRRQDESLHDYATTLEAKVKERTRELEESTHRELAQAREVARLKDEFVFIATHELRAPVTTLQWSLSLMQKEKKFLNALPAAVQKPFSFITISIQRLRELINDLLNVARLEYGTVIIHKEPMKVAGALISCLGELEPMAKEKGISVRFEPEALRALPPVLGDEGKLHEVFTNLISNAIKFNRPGGRITVQGRARDSFLEISVTDTGIGVSQENLPRLFTKFFRAREDIEGTGLGLWISREIMRRLDGDIVVESEEGKGSTFTVKIPIAQ